MLGFAMRAGKLVIGTEQVIVAMRKGGDGKPKTVLVTHTASDATKEKIGFKCQYYEVPLFVLPLSGEELGHRLGKTYSPAVIGVTDERFSDEIRKILGPDTIAMKGSLPDGETGEQDGSKNK